MPGTSPNGERVVYNEAAPIYWRITLWCYGRCAIYWRFVYKVLMFCATKDSSPCNSTLINLLRQIASGVRGKGYC